MKKTVLITGASRGIGAAAARLFAENGYSVAINYLTGEKAAMALRDELSVLGFEAQTFCADVSDSEQANILIDGVTKHFGKIDVLVNNAGVAWQGLIQQMSDSEYRKIMDVNFGGVFNCTRAVLPQMITRKCGSIVNVSSILGVSGGSCEVIYSASKAAVIGFTRALSKEVGPSGIRVNCIAPGVIATDMNSMHSEQTLKELAQASSLEKIGTSLQAAQAILFLAGEGADFITGQTLGVDGGLII